MGDLDSCHAANWRARNALSALDRCAIHVHPANVSRSRARAFPLAETQGALAEDGLAFLRGQLR
jgi:hypothetical protein